MKNRMYYLLIPVYLFVAHFRVSILFSLVFQFAYRGLMANAYDKLQNQRE